MATPTREHHLGDTHTAIIEAIDRLEKWAEQHPLNEYRIERLGRASHHTILYIVRLFTDNKVGADANGKGLTLASAVADAFHQMNKENK